jgi:hypothetical protein
MSSEISDLDKKINNLKKQIKVFEEQKTRIENDDKLWVVTWVEIVYNEFNVAVMESFVYFHSFEEKDHAEKYVEIIRKDKPKANGIRTGWVYKPKST